MLDRQDTLTVSIQRVVDRRQGRLVEVGDLLELNPQSERRKFQLRRDINRAHVEGLENWLCGECEHPVFMRLSSVHTPHFAHRSGAPSDCPWYDGAGSLSRDELGAKIYGGKQVSEIHERVVFHLQKLLPREPGFVRLTRDERLNGEQVAGYRIPDIFAEIGERRYAFEVQRSPIIPLDYAGRESFYRREGIALVWIHRRSTRSDMRAYEKDIFFDRKENIFEIDHDVMVSAEEVGQLRMRCSWREPLLHAGGEISYVWKDRLVGLADLVFEEGGVRPFVIDAEALERDAFRQWFRSEWARDVTYNDFDALSSDDPDYEIELRRYELTLRRRGDLLAQTIKRAGITADKSSLDELMKSNRDDYISMLLSIETDTPIDSAQNLKAMVDSKLQRSETTWPLARLVDLTLRACGRDEVCNRPSYLHKQQRFERTRIEEPARPDWVKLLIRLTFHLYPAVEKLAKQEAR